MRQEPSEPVYPEFEEANREAAQAMQDWEEHLPPLPPGSPLQAVPREQLEASRQRYYERIGAQHAVPICQACGRSPAALFTIRRHVGMLFRQAFYKWEGWLCRDHAMPILRAWLAKTIVQGWWGLISFFVNFFVIGADIIQMIKAIRLPAPD